jgi:hypothetical protein
LDISGNQICGLNNIGKGTYDTTGLAALAKSIGNNLKELNISSNRLKAEGAKILAPALQDSGSLSSANLLGNSIGVEQAHALLKSKEAKRGLKTLCGFTMDETELDLSGKRLCAGCALLLASEIPDMGSLASLNISNNEIVSSLNIHEPNSYKVGDMVEYHGTKCPVVGSPGSAGYDILLLHGIVALTSVIQDMGSLASLDISRNRIGDEQEAKIEQICAGKSIKCTL